VISQHSRIVETTEKKVPLCARGFATSASPIKVQGLGFEGWSLRSASISLSKDQIFGLKVGCILECDE
jgi:hypothetical protein